MSKKSDQGGIESHSFAVLFKIENHWKKSDQGGIESWSVVPEDVKKTMRRNQTKVGLKVDVDDELWERMVREEIRPRWD
ncbi:MAG: hypothetical protein OD814_001534 [Candidatus Alkanophagales archaeon MCA70_species_1]|nr:hypothetical protein [Candidatus Alkanophaga volatiphilum]